MTYEESKYTVIKVNKIYEIRYYNDRLAVQTHYNYNARSFRKLFNCISGSNKKSPKIKMTTSVIETEKIAMTIPVTQIEYNKMKLMQFYLPSNYTIDTAPIPTDPTIELVNIKGVRTSSISATYHRIIIKVIHKVLPALKNPFVLELHQKLFSHPLGLANVEHTPLLNLASEGCILWELHFFG